MNRSGLTVQIDETENDVKQQTNATKTKWFAITTSQQQRMQSNSLIESKFGHRKTFTKCSRSNGAFRMCCLAKHSIVATTHIHRSHKRLKRCRLPIEMIIWSNYDSQYLPFHSSYRSTYCNFILTHVRTNDVDIWIMSYYFGAVVDHYYYYSSIRSLQAKDIWHETTNISLIISTVIEIDRECKGTRQICLRRQRHTILTLFYSTHIVRTPETPIKRKLSVLISFYA